MSKFLHSIHAATNSLTACPAGQWGAGCLKLCNCKTPDTECDPTNGCKECPSGFEGGDCSNDINECDTSPCDANSKCVNTPGTFRCDCDEGYTQVNATTCKGMSLLFRYDNEDDINDDDD